MSSLARRLKHFQMEVESTDPDAQQAKDRHDRAWRAVQTFRKMTPSFTGFARAITGNRKVRVQVAQGQDSTSSTDGTTIWIYPPIELGDRLDHDRQLCDKRDRETKMQKCYACMARESLVRRIYHEIAHIVFKSTERPTDEARDHMRALVAEWHPKGACSHAFEIEPLIRTAETYLQLSAAFSPFLNHLFNVIEDARIDSRMYQVRPGLRLPIEAFIHHTFMNGTTGLDGVTQFWRDQAINAQMIIGTRIIGMGMPMRREYLDPEAIQLLTDEEVIRISQQAQFANGTVDSFMIAIEVLRRYQEFGVCYVPKCQPPPPMPSLNQEPGDKSEDSDQKGDGEEDGDDQGDGGSSGPDSDPSDERDGDESSSGSSPDGDAGESGSRDGGDESEPDDGSDSTGGKAGEDDDADYDNEDSTRDGDDSKDSGGDDSSESGSASSEDPNEVPSDGTGQQPETHGTDDDDAGDGEESGSDSGGSSAGATGQDAGQPGQDGGDQGELDEPSDGSDQGTDGDQLHDGVGDGPGADGQGADPGEQGDRDAGEDASDPVEDLEDGDDPGDDYPQEGDDSDGSEASGDGVDEPHDVWENDYGDAEMVAAAIDLLDTHDKEREIQQDGEMQGFLASDQDTDGEEQAANVSAISTAVSQSNYFDTKSKTVRGVVEMEYGDSNPLCIWPYDDRHNRSYGNPRYSSKDQQRYREYYGRLDGWDAIQPPESILGPALRDARIVFSNNQATKTQGNRKSGLIDARVLGRRAPVQDPRLFAKRTRPGRRNYEVLLGLDCSGSTHSSERNIRIKRAAFAQAELMHRLGIPFSIYGHTGGAELENLTEKQIQSYYNDDLDVPVMDLVILKIKKVNEPWNNEIKMRLANMPPSAENLDGHTIEYYRKKIAESQATDKIICYYTDGQMPAANGVEEAVVLGEQLKLCKQQNITILGVGINTESPKDHGLDTVRVDSDEDLRGVIKHLKKYLT